MHRLLQRLHIYHTKRIVPKSFKNNLEKCLNEVYTGKGEDRHQALKFSEVMEDIEHEKLRIMEQNTQFRVDKSAKGAKVSCAKFLILLSSSACCFSCSSYL